MQIRNEEKDLSFPLRSTLLKSYKDGGKVDWSGIKTTNNRPYNPDYIGYINTALQNGGMNDYQRAAVLANIIEESGGDPFAKSGNGFYGLLQWASDRYTPTKEKDVYREIDNQVKTILSTAGNATDRKSWTHGGKGSGYNSLKDAMNAYNGKTIEDVMKGYTLGYVRPTGGLNSYSNRLKVAQQILGKEGFSTFRGGGSIHIDPSKRGTFKAQATKMGMSTQAAASHILAHKENYSPAMVKKAVFAKNFAHRHDDGGTLFRRFDGGGRFPVFSPLADFRSAHAPVREPEFRGFGGGDFGGAGYATRFDVGVDPLVSDQYVRNTPIFDEISFSDAYARARKAGLKEFDFNGQRYNTDYDPNAKIGPRVTAVSPVLNIREVLDENKNPISDSTRVEPYTGQIPGVHRKDYGGLIEKYGADQILKAIGRRKERLK